MGKFGFKQALEVFYYLQEARKSRWIPAYAGMTGVELL
jgi:hypothetical protein